MATRRDFCLAAFGAAAAMAGCRFAIDSSTASLPPIANDADIDALLPRLSNWGRWGADDERGTLNLITPDHRVAAAQTVRRGESISLARETSLLKTPGVRRPAYEMMKSEHGSRDFIGMVYHGFAMTHYDALGHIFASPEAMYNNLSTSHITEEGAQRLGAQGIAGEGVVGRGVLLDIAAAKGGALDPGTAITIADLERAEERQGVRVGEGDILLVRTGAGPRNTRELRAGLHPHCLPWLRERGVALLGSDGDNDVHPSGFERWPSAMHSVGIPYLGLHLLDNADLDPLGAACARLRRWAFLFTMAPLRIHGLTGSPVNPLAVF